MPIRILIVEDEPRARSALHEYFSLRGLEVRSACTGKRAIELGLVFRPRILLCDWWLGGNEDGVDVATILSRALDGLQIIFMTGHSREHLGHLCRNLRVEGIYQKPIRLADLRALIDDISHHRQRSC